MRTENRSAPQATRARARPLALAVGLRRPRVLNLPDWPSKFAMVPVGVLRGGNALSDGAVKFLVVCYALTRLQTARDDDIEDFHREFRAPRGGWGRALGCSDRAARAWRSELVTAGIIDRVETWDGGPAIFSFAEHVGGVRRKIPLAGWAALPPALARTLAVVITHSRNGEARIGRKTLAASLGVGVDAVSARIANLAARGRLKVYRCRRGANRYEILDTGFRAGGAERKPVSSGMRKSASLAGGAERNAEGGGTKTRRGGERNLAWGGTKHRTI